MAYTDLHEHLKKLEANGLLRRVTRLINKDTELHPLVRWQYRGLTEEDRKAWLFENVTDAKGRRYNMPVVVGALAGNPGIYYLGMGCKTAEEMDAMWKKALSEPIAPVAVSNAKCQDVVHIGDELDKEGFGLDKFPVPISTPGFDNGPYTTCSHWITADPETGIQNIGNYRGQIKARRRVGVFPSGLGQDIYLHWKKAQARGTHLPAALVVGAPPIVSYVSVQKVPYGVDELGVAGGLAGEPIPTVKCKTHDIMVPADAEIVIEGFLNTEWIEPEGPFGESHGYMHPRQLNPFMDVTAITHRKDAIYTSWLSQLTPSESSVIRKIGYDRLMLVHLRDECRITSVLRVEMHEPLTNTYKLVIIQMRRPNEAEVWRALHAACSFHPGVGKIVVAVDEDIDPSNEAAVFWAMCYRMKPHKDVQIFPGMEKGHAPPFLYEHETKGTDVVSYHLPADESAMRCHGSATPLASGAKSSIKRRRWRCKGATSKSVRKQKPGG
ncbi:MAG: UbiD family decarboxylase [Deltaproteobacteria bacterium]|nr:UbiD family decarboxylase [Deltaproteobacteria bacterium]